MGLGEVCLLLLTCSQMFNLDHCPVLSSSASQHDLPEDRPNRVSE